MNAEPVSFHNWAGCADPVSRLRRARNKSVCASWREVGRRRSRAEPRVRNSRIFRSFSEPLGPPSTCEHMRQQGMLSHGVFFCWMWSGRDHATPPTQTESKLRRTLRDYAEPRDAVQKLGREPLGRRHRAGQRIRQERHCDSTPGWCGYAGPHAVSAFMTAGVERHRRDNPVLCA